MSLHGVQVLCGGGLCRFNEVGHVFGCLGDAGDEILEEFVLFGSELLDDVGEEVFDGLGLWFSADDEGVVLDGGVGCVSG